MTEIARAQQADAFVRPSDSILPARAKIFAWLLGGFLLLTALLKSFSPEHSAMLQSGYGIPRWLTIAAIQAELVVGLLLISGGWRRLAWPATFVLFAAFAAFSLYRALAGYESCGCFGPLKINPWWTLALDAGILTVLVAWRRELTLEPAQPAANRRRWFCAAAYPALSALTLALMVSSGPLQIDAATPLQDDGRLVILEPQTWVGQPFPLSDHIAPHVDFSQGDWTVLLYHHDCPKCQEALPQYEELAASAASAHVLFVQMPPYAHEAFYRPTAATHARLSDEREWFVQAPMEIRVSAGKVVDASGELPSLPRSSP